MPAQRNHGKSKKLSEGERFALALGLENKPDLFKNCKEIFRRRADKHFDLTIPPAEQEEAMLDFIQDVTSVFPGYFNGAIHSNIEERVNGLQTYAISYLTKSGKMTALPKTGGQKGRKRAKVEETNPEVMQVARPKPKPAYRRAGTTDEQKYNPQPAVRTVKKPQQFPRPPVEVAKPIAPGDPVVQPTLRQGPETPEPVVTPPPADSIPTFLAQCRPPMPHLAAALCKAGVESRQHILGMAKWKEAKLRKFLNAHITTTALEEETIVDALEKLNTPT